MDAIRLDGAIGEGGGQILRTSLSLSMVTGRPFRIENIRAGRPKPGLLRQHLTAVLAAAEVSGAGVEGATPGSTSLSFVPGPVRPGEYHFAVGTAGSSTLVLQTLLPALMLATAPSRVTLEGGTHNDAAPPFDFLARVFLPLIARMGPKLAVSLERYGFYPAGGGRFLAEIEPVARLAPLDIGERGEIDVRRVTAIIANLAYNIAKREVDTACKLLNWGPETASVVGTRNSAGPGNVLMVEVGSGEGNELFTDFGKLGVSAEQVAANVVREVREYLASTAVAGEHLADQLLLPCALAGAGSFTATKVNSHARSNMEVIRHFLPVRFEERQLAGCVQVTAVTSRPTAA